MAGTGDRAEIFVARDAFSIAVPREAEETACMKIISPMLVLRRYIQ